MDAMAPPQGTALQACGPGLLAASEGKPPCMEPPGLATTPTQAKWVGVDTGEGLSKQPQLPSTAAAPQEHTQGALAPRSLLATWGSRGDLEGTRGDMSSAWSVCGCPREA